MTYLQLAMDGASKHIWILFWVLAAISNACMDVLWSRFDRSVFKNKDPKWWNPNISWKYQPLYLGYRVDAWHLAKTGMIGFITLAMTMHIPIFGYWDLLLIGVLWNGTFELFYSLILITKK